MAVLVCGHLLLVLIAGFPLGAIHLIVAVVMGVAGWIFGSLVHKNIYLANLVAIIFNGILVSGLLIPILGVGFFLGITLTLLVDSTINIILVTIIYNYFKEKLK